MGGRAGAIRRAATPRAMPKQQGDAANLLRTNAELSPSFLSFFFFIPRPAIEQGATRYLS